MEFTIYRLAAFSKESHGGNPAGVVISADSLKVEEMQKIAKEIKPEDIIEIILRRRWWIIIPFILSIVVGICLAFMLPKKYISETLVLIQPQKVPMDYVQPVITTDIDSRIEALSRQILSLSTLLSL